MIDIGLLEGFFSDPEALAEEFLRRATSDGRMTLPIRPFQLLTEMGVPFIFRDFDRYEGVYLPANDVDGYAVVGINFNRPLQRQRFTAAHEICHHIKDSRSSVLCGINNKNDIEKFADKFAGALLMPFSYPAPVRQERNALWKKSCRNRQ